MPGTEMKGQIDLPKMANKDMMYIRIFAEIKEVLGFSSASLQG